MKRLFYEVAFLLALFCVSFLASFSVFAMMDALECSNGCACKDGGDCKCFAVATEKCRCGDCNCQESGVRVDGLAAITEEEFEAFKLQLKKQIADRKKKPCCPD